MSELPQVPNHVGLIMDGNRRWAKANGVSTIEGHRKGYQALRTLLKEIKGLGISYISVYAFSTENWKRSKEEVQGLMKLLRWVLKNEISEITKEGLRVIFVGSRDNVPEDMLKLIDDAEAKTADFTEGTLAICFNYGGKQEVVEAVNSLILDDIEVTEESIDSRLYKSEIPPADLIIRTSGEQRLSNYMLWRSSYAELSFTDTLWPDFKATEFTQIVTDFTARSRRFGE